MNKILQAGLMMSQPAKTLELEVAQMKFTEKMAAECQCTRMKTDPLDSEGMNITYVCMVCLMVLKVHKYQTS